jgi:hypothetical protein
VAYNANMTAETRGPRNRVSATATWVLVLALPAAAFAAYQLAAVALMTPARHTSEVNSWRTSHELESRRQAESYQAQIQRVQSQAAVTAATASDTNQKVDSLICSLVQEGRPVGRHCVLPSGERRSLGSGVR